MGHGTKKVGMAGRFGPHYGARIRNVWRDIMEREKGVQKCPRCGTKLRNMRLYIGVWHCRRCGAQWTGGAWTPDTPRGREAQRIAVRVAREVAIAEAEKAGKKPPVILEAPEEEYEEYEEEVEETVEDVKTEAPAPKEEVVEKPAKKASKKGKAAKEEEKEVKEEPKAEESPKADEAEPKEAKKSRKKKEKKEE